MNHLARRDGADTSRPRHCWTGASRRNLGAMFPRRRCRKSCSSGVHLQCSNYHRALPGPYTGRRQDAAVFRDLKESAGKGVGSPGGATGNRPKPSARPPSSLARPTPSSQALPVITRRHGKHGYRGPSAPPCWSSSGVWVRGKTRRLGNRLTKPRIEAHVRRTSRPHPT
jgi:hypothetical protein